MRFIYTILLFFLFSTSQSQSINLNESFINEYLRTSQLIGDYKGDFSFTQLPIDLGNNGIKINDELFDSKLYASNILKTKKIKLKILPLNYNIEFNSNHPYNRNNGSMIPNRGYQHIISAGLFFEFGPLSIQLKPELLFAENRDFEGFGEGPNGHNAFVWSKRYKLWNKIDLPEKFGNNQHNEVFLGQSNIRINVKGISLGLSNENIWWGPSIRNSIMMSNNSRGFLHLTLNSSRPLKTAIGNFEWQILTGRLESSGYPPGNHDSEYSNRYVPKINQLGETDDWRYLQGYTITYSPRWISGFSLGFIRWVQMYSALVKGKYTWMDGSPTWFPAFQNLFRKNDKYENYEAQTNQAAGLFLRWLWKDSNAEIYAEYHHNDSKQNLRDLLLDSDHSRAVTIGLQKVFIISGNNYLFSWEWTQMEQTASRLLRNAGSWYEHSWTYDGYTNRGEVLGSSIGPGSNSHYFSLSKVNEKYKLGVAIEIIDHDNDFYHEAFSSAKDPRRYWKDFNFHINYNKKINNFWFASTLLFSRSLNYMWDLDDNATNYYHPGNDVNNFHASFKMTYMIPFSN